MVCFQESQLGVEPALAILDEEAPAEPATKLVVAPPLIGHFAAKFPITSLEFPEHWCKRCVEAPSGNVLLSPHHRESSRNTPYVLLRDSVASGASIWTQNGRFPGDFAHIPRYWEWLEATLFQCSSTLEHLRLQDAVYASRFTYKRAATIFRAACESWCSATNTLHTAAGELSISLLDLQYLGGLPILGEVYDEVTPSCSELSGIGRDGVPYLPRACAHLFKAYHIIPKKKGKVSLQRWCEFWFPGKIKYTPSSSKKNEAKVPSPTSNWWSELGDPQPWSNPLYRPLSDLDVAKADYEETYLAAFLSCWLCAFVLPVSDPGLIRPGTFKVASLMASGRRFSLAIPVLASIYRGLNETARSASPGKSGTCFPVHFVYAWLAAYFRTHNPLEDDLGNARMVNFSGDSTMRSFEGKKAVERITSGSALDWDATASKAKVETALRDDEREGLSRYSADFLVAIRSSHLTLRCEGTCIVEPYSPHRFARQFGYWQDIPGDLSLEHRRGTLEQLFNLFHASTARRTGSSFIIPSHSFDFAKRVTPRYKEWWSSVYRPPPAKPRIKILMRGLRTSPTVEKAKGSATHSTEETAEVATDGAQGASKAREANFGKAMEPRPVSTAKATEPTEKTATKKTVPLATAESTRHSKPATTAERHPRVQEISDDVDSDPERDHYFKRRRRRSVRASEDQSDGLLADATSYSGHMTDITKILNGKEFDQEAQAFMGGYSASETVAGPEAMDISSRDLPESWRIDHHPVFANVVPDPPPASRPESPAISTFPADGIIQESNRTAVRIMADAVRAKVCRTTMEKTTALRGVFDPVYAAIEQRGIDASPLRLPVERYLKEVAEFLTLEADISRKSSEATRDVEISKVRSDILEVKEQRARHQQTAKEADSEFTAICHRREHLQRELEELDAKAKHFKERSSLLMLEVVDCDDTLAHLDARLADLQQTPIATPEEQKTLAAMKSFLVESRDTLQALQWPPK